MKAVVARAYGRAKEVLEVKEVEKPSIKTDELLIRVEYTTVNRTDTDVLKAWPFFIRLNYGLLKPKRPILGREFAGVVEAKGAGVKGFEVGDEVFGYSGDDAGCHAEYMVINEGSSISKKPENMSMKDASSILDGIILSNPIVKRAEGRVLVYGASGSIGIATIQQLKAKGVEVVAVCSTRHIEVVKSLGVDEVYDYTKDDSWLNEKGFDSFVDAVGKRSFSFAKKFLKEKGSYFTTDLGFMWCNIPLILLTHIFKGKRVILPIPTHNKQDILEYKGLVEAGKYRAVIDREYGLDKLVEAFEYVDSGKKQGNVVVKIGVGDEGI